MSRKIRSSSIQRKFDMFVFWIIIILVGFHFAVNDVVVSKFFSIVEKDEIQKSVKNASIVMKGKMDKISSISKDYSVWNETHERVLSKGDENEFFEENFTKWLPSNFGIDIISIVRRDGKLLKHHGTDIGFVDEILPAEDCQKIMSCSVQGEGYFEKTGYVYYNSNIYIVALTPVLMSDYSGESAGMLVLGDRIDDEMLEEIKEETGMDMFFERDGSILASADKIRNFIESEYGGGGFAFAAEIEGVSYSIKKEYIYDISGERIGSFGILSSRELLGSLENLMRLSALAVLMASFLLVLLVSARFKVEVINPIKRLEEQVSIMGSKDMLVKIKESGPEEVVRLTRKFNVLVEKVYKSREGTGILRVESQRDELTQLYNHRKFHEIFEEKVDSGFKHIAVIFCDVDKFKNVNSSYGYGIGDMLLVEISRYLKSKAPKDALVFRYGGEEFALMLLGKDAENARAIAERLRRGLAKSANVQRYSDHMPVTLSMGVAFYPSDSTSSHGIVEKCEVAMHYSKQTGRNSVSVYARNIENMLFKDRKEFKNNNILIDSVIAITKAIDAKDSYTGRHSDNVAKYSLLLAEKLGFSESDMEKLRMGALLHDCGKIGIPDLIINKPFRLDMSESEYMTRHPILGYNIVKNIIEDEEVLACVRYHHEKWDGSGYPDGLSGREIPLYARIVCIADSFHAMISDRPYRKALRPEEAVAEIEKNASIQFDPELAVLFAQAVREELEKEIS